MEELYHLKEKLTCDLQATLVRIDELERLAVIFNHVPDEVWVEILGRVGSNDLKSLVLVCKTWHRVLENNFHVIYKHRISVNFVKVLSLFQLEPEFKMRSFFFINDFASVYMGMMAKYPQRRLIAQVVTDIENQSKFPLKIQFRRIGRQYETNEFPITHRGIRIMCRLLVTWLPFEMEDFVVNVKHVHTCGADTVKFGWKRWEFTHVLKE